MLYAKAVKDVYLRMLKNSSKSPVTVREVARDGVALVNHVTSTTYSSKFKNNIFLNNIVT